MRNSLAIGAVGLVLFTSSFAAAQEEPNAADVSAARALGQEGVKLADQGNCKDAIDKLSRSEKLFHAPTTLEKLGECQVSVGRLVDGTENLNRVIRESLPASAPQAFRDAQDRAKKILADAKPKIAKLKIAVAGPADNNYLVKLDGEVVPPANLNMNRPTDPGEHVIEASAPGYKTATSKVTLPEGGNDSVALTLEVDPNAPKNPPPVVRQPNPTTEPNTTAQPNTTTNPPPSSGGADQGSSRLPAYVTLGIGGAGVVVGSIFGLLAVSKKSDIQNQCQGTRCPTKVQDDLDSGRAFGTVSTVGFIVAGVGLVAGTYLFLTEGPKSGSNPPSTRVGANGFKLSF
jgi:hypothetical protein